MNGDRNAVLVTGATGFVGLELVRRLVRRGRTVYAVCRGAAPGTAELERYEHAGRVRLFRGDLAEPSLGLSAAQEDEIARNVSTIGHVAAYYRLSGRREPLWRVNVEGLTNLLARTRSWAIEHFHHVSSITVAGDADGEVPERPLPRPARFRNPYEESKWVAESLLFERAEMPRAVYRPGIIVGSADDGEIPKFDGPYEAFGLMRPFLPFVIPGSGRQPFPMVTVDLVADALLAGIERPPADTVAVFHVLDLDPPTLEAFSRAMAERIAGHGRVVTIPASLGILAARLPGFAWLTGMEPEAIEYMNARTTFAVDTFARFCADRGVEGRRLKSAYDVIALYYALVAERSCAGVR